LFFLSNGEIWRRGGALKKSEIIAATTIVAALCLYIIGKIYLSILNQWNSEWAYYGFGTADFMLNYEGGFVRRGLMGQLLLWLFQIHPYPLHQAVYGFEIALIVALGVVSAIMCKRMNWYPILPMAIMIVPLEHRRDFMMFLLTFAVFSLLFKHITTKKYSYLVYSIILMTLSLVIYEPCFFFIFPLPVIIYWTAIEGNVSKRLMKICKVFALPVIVMAILTTAGRGSADKELKIWESWQILFEHIDAKYKPDEIPGAINFLERSPVTVMETHWYRNYHTDQEDSTLYVSGSILMMLCIWFLITNIPVDNKNKAQLASIALLLFICHIPMLTVLSCDLGRTMYSIIFPTMFTVYLSSKHGYEFNIPVIGETFIRISNVLEKVPIINTLWFYIYVLLMMPYTFCCGISINRHLYIEFQEFYDSMMQIISQ